MKVLFIGSHPDDIELGCGGTLLKLSDFTKLTITGGRTHPLDQRLDTVPFLDIVCKIEKMVKRLKPDTVYSHNINDLNLDHQIVARATLTVCRPLSSSVKAIYSYEVLSSTEWGFGFTPNTYQDITPYFDEKLKLLEKYKAELREFPHPRSLEGAEVLAKYRGMQVGVKYAEAFMLIRGVW